MTAKDYCSKVCGAKCCKAHAPIVWPPKCPKLTDDNLCSIYEKRIGFRFPAKAVDGGTGTCVCSGPETFVKTLPPEVRAQCCFAHPKLLENDQGIEAYELDDIDDDEPDDTCPECGGSGTDRYNDHILECPKCDGEGTL